MRCCRLLCGFCVVLASTFAVGGEPVHVIPKGTIRNAKQPQVTVDRSGRILIAYGSESSVYCSISADGGKSYAKPVKVGQMNGLSLGARRGPRIGVHGDTVVVTAIGGDVGRGRDGDLLAWRSVDGGKTFSGPEKVNDVTSSAREGLHAMASGPQGELFCAWLDLRNDRTELFSSRSTDRGKTWSRNRLIYRSPDRSICECCHPSAVFDAKGNLYAMWRNSIDGKRDMYLAVRRKGDQSFGKAKKLGSGSWTIDHCPMAGGSLAVTADSKVMTVWRRKNRLFRTGEKIAEQPLGNGLQPWLTGGKRGAFLVWIDRRFGDLFLLSPGTKHASRLGHRANDPAIAAPLSGKGPVVAVWEAGSRRNSTVMAAVVSK